MSDGATRTIHLKWLTYHRTRGEWKTCIRLGKSGWHGAIIRAVIELVINGGYGVSGLWQDMCVGGGQVKMSRSRSCRGGNRVSRLGVEYRISWQWIYRGLVNLLLFRGKYWKYFLKQRVFLWRNLGLFMVSYVYIEFAHSLKRNKTNGVFTPGQGNDKTNTKFVEPGEFNETFHPGQYK